MRYRNALQQIWTWVLSIAGLLVLTIALPSLSIWVVLMTGIVSLIAVLHPLPRLWLPTRKKAGCVLALSFGLLAVGGAHLPEPPPATPEEFEAQAEKWAAQAEVRIRQAKVRGEARRRTEAAKKRPAAVIQAEANAARLATRAEASGEDHACRASLECWGEKHSFAASFRCPDQIERLAKYDHEWTDGWLGTKFSHFAWKDRQTGAITYIGDQIKFQNGFGAWVPHTYHCDFDPIKREVLDVRAMAGRLQATR